MEARRLNCLMTKKLNPNRMIEFGGSKGVSGAMR
jgi:hypothetical protein